MSFAALRAVPVRDENTGTMVGQYFEPSNEFKAAVKRNMTEVVRIDGRTVFVNRKLQRLGHYSDRPGFDMPAESKTIVVQAAQAPATPLQLPQVKEKSK